MKSWNDQQLIDAIATSKTKAEVIKKLGLTAAGSYKFLDFHIKRLMLDTSHFIKYHKSNLTRKSKRQLSELLVQDGRYGDHKTIKKKLIETGVLPYNCSICKLSSWQDRPITLQLDHINGSNTDNRLENLRLLCPNCHSQTDTFSTRKTKQTKKYNICSMCHKNISLNATMCTSCVKTTSYNVHWPPISELLSMLNKSNFCYIARQLGTSDNAIRKHLKKHGIDFRRPKKDSNL